jgi:cytochrome c-type biogenesis protein CcmF
VLLGTLYPLFVDALGLGKISVGPPYFNAVFVPLVTPLLFLAGVGPMARWKQASVPDLAARLKWGFAASVVVALLLPLTQDTWEPLVSMGILMALWIAVGTAINVQGRLRHSTKWSANFYGMNLAHLGVAVTVIGITMVSAYQTERNVRMNVGDTLTLKGYTFLFKGAEDLNGPNYTASRGTLEVSRNGKPVTTLYPEKRTYLASGMPFSSSAIDYGFTRDLYAAMGERLDGGAWSVRLFHKPFVVWIWIGAVLMALGGAISITDRRYRNSRKKVRVEA